MKSTGSDNLTFPMTLALQHCNITFDSLDEMKEYVYDTYLKPYDSRDVITIYDYLCRVIADTARQQTVGDINTII